jgi:predicted transcriptional regulator
MSTLFTVRSNFRVERISEADARRGTDHLKLFERLLVSNEAMYPNIRSWFRGKVVPDLRSGSRVAFIGYEGERPIITAVVKKGGMAKFCHLRIEDEFQDNYLGVMFFALMALEVRRCAKEIHFTLPESLWYKKLEFFSSFGFRDAVPSARQYRLFEEELRCSAPFSMVWQSVIDRLPEVTHRFNVNEYSMAPRLLLSLRPEFAEAVLQGKKTVEIRRRFSPKWEGERIALYSSRPASALVGEATVNEVIFGSPAEVWETYGPQISCTEPEFSTYTQDCQEVWAIGLTDVVRYRDKILLSQVQALVNEDLIPPQSYCDLDGSRPWSKAVSLAALLHGNLRWNRPSDGSMKL